MMPGCPELLIISDEIIGIVKRILKGISIGDESLALDVIANIGSASHSMAQKHTLKYLTREIYILNYLIENQN